MRLHCTIQPNKFSSPTLAASNYLRDMELRSEGYRSRNSFPSLFLWSMGPKVVINRGSVKYANTIYCTSTVSGFSRCTIQVKTVTRTSLLFHKHMTSIPGKSVWIKKTAGKIWNPQGQSSFQRIIKIHDRIVSVFRCLAQVRALSGTPSLNHKHMTSIPIKSFWIRRLPGRLGIPKGSHLFRGSLDTRQKPYLFSGALHRSEHCREHHRLTISK